MIFISLLFLLGCTESDIAPSIHQNPVNIDSLSTDIIKDDVTNGLIDSEIYNALEKTV